MACSGNKHLEVVVSCVLLAAFRTIARSSIILVRIAKWWHSSNVTIASSFTYLHQLLDYTEIQPHRKGQIKLHPFPLFSSFQNELVICHKWPVKFAFFFQYDYWLINLIFEILESISFTFLTDAQIFLSLFSGSISSWLLRLFDKASIVFDSICAFSLRYSSSSYICLPHVWHQLFLHRAH